MSSNIILNKQIVENKTRDITTSQMIDNIIKKSQKNITMKNIQKELNSNSSKVSIFLKNDLVNIEDVYKRDLISLEMMRQKQNESTRKTLHHQNNTFINDLILLKKNS